MIITIELLIFFKSRKSCILQILRPSIFMLAILNRIVQPDICAGAARVLYWTSIYLSVAH